MAAGITLLSALAIAVLGYHPYAEDGGVYLAGVEKLLNPSLFPTHAEFVLAPMRTSLFAPVLAAVVRVAHVPLPYLFLGLFCGSVWLTLLSVWKLASHTASSPRGRWGAVALVACTMGMPIAGTSLMLMDPYLTARSISTPLVLLAWAWALGGGRLRWLWCALALAGAAAMHPLMAGYGALAMATAAASTLNNADDRRKAGWALGALALGVAAIVQAGAPPETPDYLRIVITRYYWFPFQWEWYELFGLIAPLLLLAWFARRPRVDAAHALGQSALLLGGISLAVASAFARSGMAAHLVSRMQPLRCFQLIYVALLVVLGAWLAEGWSGARRLRLTAGIVMLAGLMFAVQRATFSNSDHLEVPWCEPRNAWEQAFLWAHGHTPPDALFALDARYITRGRGEDAQSFRPLAQRSALPDYSKDGGEAAIAPDLTAAWVDGQTAQTGLESAPDAARMAALKPRGVTWVILERPSPTQWQCPYTNAWVKVCQLP